MTAPDKDAVIRELVRVLEEVRPDVGRGLWAEDRGEVVGIIDAALALAKSALPDQTVKM